MTDRVKRKIQSHCVADTDSWAQGAVRFLESLKEDMFDGSEEPTQFFHSKEDHYRKHLAKIEILEIDSMAHKLVRGSLTILTSNDPRVSNVPPTPPPREREVDQSIRTLQRGMGGGSSSQGGTGRGSGRGASRGMGDIQGVGLAMIYNSHAKNIPYLDRDFSSNEEWPKVAKKMLMPRDGQDRPIAPVEDAKVCTHAAATLRGCHNVICSVCMLHVGA